MGKIKIAGLISLIIAALVLLIFITTSSGSTRPQKSLAENIGELTLRYAFPNYANSFESDTTSAANIYFTPNGTEFKQQIVNILKGDKIRIFTPENELEAMDLVITPETSMATLLNYRNEGFSMQQFDKLLVSGKTIYFPLEAINSYQSDPSKTYSALTAAFVETKLFLGINELQRQSWEKQKAKYDLASNPKLRGYMELFSAENNLNTNWAASYPNKILEYKEKSDSCSYIASYSSQIGCEITLYQNNFEELLPSTQRKYIENEFKLNKNALSADVGRADIDEIAEMIEELKLSRAGLEYAAWGFPKFQLDVTQQGDSLYRQKISGENWKKLIDILKKNNWRLDSETKIINDRIFAAPTQKFVFRKQNNVYEQELSIRRLDTAGLNSDCIIEGEGSQYCETNSIYKNTGYYIEIAVGDKLK